MRNKCWWLPLRLRKDLVIQVRRTSAVALVFVLAGCSAAKADIPDPAPPCPVDTYDECLAKKAEEFGLAVDDRSRPDFLLAAYEPACDAQDADACFMLGSIFSGSEATRAPLPQTMSDALPVDKEKAMIAYRKSCSLGSAMGCATLANFIAPDADTFQNLTSNEQIQFLIAQKKSCDLGMLISCDVYLDTARSFDPEKWPDGPHSYFTQETSVAAVPCSSGDHEGCFSEALATVLSAKYPPGTKEDYDDGIRMLKDNCAEGHQGSCDLLEKVND